MGRPSICVALTPYFPGSAAATGFSCDLLRSRPSCCLKRRFESSSAGALASWGVTRCRLAPRYQRWGHMLDRRNTFERSVDAKRFLAIIALTTMPILWLTKIHLGVWQYVLDFGISIILLFGLYLLALLSVPALVFLCVLIVRKLRSAPQRSCSAFIGNQARK